VALIHHQPEFLTNALSHKRDGKIEGKQESQSYLVLLCQRTWLRCHAIDLSLGRRAISKVGDQTAGAILPNYLSLISFLSLQMIGDQSPKTRLSKPLCNAHWSIWGRPYLMSAEIGKGEQRLERQNTKHQVTNVIDYSRRDL